MTAKRTTEYLTTKEVLSYLKIHRQTLETYKRDGRITAYKLAGGKKSSCRFKLEDVEALLKPQRVTV